MKNNKFKIIVILVIIISVIAIIIGIFIPNQNTKKYESKTTKLCNNIEEKIKLKENLVLFYRANEITDESSDSIDYLVDTYSNKLNIYLIAPKEIREACIKKLIEPTLYDNIINVGDSTAIVYKHGEYSGMISGLDSYENVENYFIDQGVIEKEKIFEDITFEEYQKNLTNDKYLLLVINNENNREELSKLVEENFPNYKYNVINMKSETGNKIKNDIDKNYKSFNEFPNLLYFEKGELIYSESVIDDKTFELYKSDLEEKLNN